MRWLFYMVFLAQAGSAPAELTLEDLLKAALERDGRVLAAHAQLDAYRAKYDQAWWLWFPAAKLDVLFGGPVGRRELANPEDPTSVELKDFSAYSYGDLSAGVSFAVGGKLEAMLPIYTFGKISEAKNAALAGVDAGEAGIEKARQDVALEACKDAGRAQRGRDRPGSFQAALLLRPGEVHAGPGPLGAESRARGAALPDRHRRTGEGPEAQGNGSARAGF